MATPDEPVDPLLPTRLRSLEIVLEGEQRIERGWWSALVAWLDRIRQRVLAPFRDAQQTPDPNGVLAVPGEWEELVARRVIPPITEQMQIPYQTVLGSDRTFDEDPYVQRYLQDVTARMVRLPIEVYAQITRIITNGVDQGLSVPDIAAQVQTRLTATGSEFWPNRATTVARTETVGATNAGAFAAAAERARVEGDPNPEKVWVATHDERTRPTHVVADQQRVGLFEPFTVGGFPLQFPGDPSAAAPQETINCHPGNTRVAATSRVRKIYRRWYEGPMLRIKTSDGVELSATPNHPLLTDSGWQAAERLKVGDKLLGSSVGPGVSAGEPDVENGPATLHDLYRAALETGVQRRVVGGVVDFHGDGTDREVEVVLPDRELGDSVSGENRPNDPLVGLSLAEELLPLRGGAQGRDGTAHSSELRTPVLADGVMSLGGQSLPLFGSGVGHAEAQSLAPATHGKSEILQTADDNGSADPEVVREALDGLTGGVALREIIEIERYAFHGFVFNLETDDGWYIANDNASHNCRCSILDVVAGETIDWTNRQFTEE